MAFVKIENGVVVQKQPNAASGFIEVDDSVVCGMLYDDQTEEFSNPDPTPSTVYPVDDIVMKSKTGSKNFKVEINDDGSLQTEEVT